MPHLGLLSSLSLDLGSCHSGTELCQFTFPSVLTVTLLSGPLVTAWCILRLRLDEKASSYGE
jgi:hypothetical protein